MDTTQNYLESLIKRNRMQHFKCFTISSSVIKVSGTHKIKLFTLLVAHHLWSHKEVPIITSFCSSQFCGILHMGMETRNSQFRIFCGTIHRLQAFLNNQRSLHLKATGSILLRQVAGKQGLLWKVHKPRNVRNGPCKQRAKGFYQRSRLLWPAGYPMVSKEQLARNVPVKLAGKCSRNKWEWGGTSRQVK